MHFIWCVCFIHLVHVHTCGSYMGSFTMIFGMIRETRNALSVVRVPHEYSYAVCRSHKEHVRIKYDEPSVM